MKIEGRVNRQCSWKTSKQLSLYPNTPSSDDLAAVPQNLMLTNGFEVTSTNGRAGGLLAQGLSPATCKDRIAQRSSIQVAATLDVANLRLVRGDESVSSSKQLTVVVASQWCKAGSKQITNGNSNYLSYLVAPVTVAPRCTSPASSAPHTPPAAPAAICSTPDPDSSPEATPSLPAASTTPAAVSPAGSPPCAAVGTPDPPTPSAPCPSQLLIENQALNQKIFDL
ncbi:hypothetical protein J6590_072287 [Homalodisca vitripennis]|nr:hypothetical protein J6590_072287 [Homalodisca vitripennis]